MRKFTRTGLVAVVLAASLTVGASAANYNAKTTAYLNLRTGAGTNNKIVTVMPRGAAVTVVEDGSAVPAGWAKVIYKGTTAYAATEWLNINRSTPSATPAATATPQSTTAATTTPAAANQRGVINANYVNFRSQASTSSSIMGRFMRNNEVVILSKTGDWYNIQYGDRKGYVFAQYLTPKSGAAANTTSASASTTSTASGKGDEVVAIGKKYIGTPYRYGGASPKGFDCSGFVYYVHKQMGVTIGRGATSQMAYGTYVAKSDLQPGDIVFFRDTRRARSGATHSGIYVGNNKFIHSPTSGRTVCIESLSLNYYAKYYISARRIFN